MTKTYKITYYVLLTLVSLIFLFAGFAKLSGNAMEKMAFVSAHLPIWFMYFIGIAEIAGAIGIWIPSLQRLAVWGLGIIMVGAIVVTAIFVSPLEALAPLIVLLILISIRSLAKNKQPAM